MKPALFSFSKALELAKEGKKIARAGWNGKNQFVVMMPALYLPPYDTQDTNRKVNDRTAKHIGEGTPLDSQPYFALFNAQGKWQPGWVPSQGDLFAEDWTIVPEYTKEYVDNFKEILKDKKHEVIRGPFPVQTDRIDIIAAPEGVTFKRSFKGTLTANTLVEVEDKDLLYLHTPAVKILKDLPNWVLNEISDRRLIAKQGTLIDTLEDAVSLELIEGDDKDLMAHILFGDVLVKKKDGRLLRIKKEDFDNGKV